MKLQPQKTIISLLFTVLYISLSAQTTKISFPSKSGGMIAYPFPVEVVQPDGDTLLVRSLGNGVINWQETMDGYTVFRDSKGNYVYGIHNYEGDLVPSDILVGQRKGDTPGIRKNLRYSRSQINGFNKAYYPDDGRKANPTPFPSSGNNNVLVILAEFPDAPAVITPAEIESLMNTPEHRGTGSFRDYYLDVSYNTLDLTSTVVPWVQVSQNMSYYGADDGNGYDIRPFELVREAVDLVEAGGFDFSPFDNDNDGYVDEIILIHSGYGEQYTGAGDTCIWSHAYHLGEISVEYDGVLLDNYIICPELYGSSGSEINSIGTVVHEFAYSLALPNLFDQDSEGSGGFAFDLNFWDLMAVGSWNNQGRTPAGINAWTKRYKGWMTIPVIDTTGIFSLNRAMDFQEAYQLNTPVYNEYFILENRQRIGFDSHIPGEGLLIYHVDMNHPGWMTGKVNVDPEYQGFDIEEADDIRDTVSLPGDPFPGTAGITRFDSLSTPGSNTWNGNSSNISIQNITSTSGVITFEILNSTYNDLPVGWSVDELSYTRQGVVVAMIVVEGDTAKSGYLGAFVGEECRGITTSTHYDATGKTLFDLSVYSNSTGGELLEFRYFDPVVDSIYDLYEEIIFTTGTIAGSPEDTYLMHAPFNFSRSFHTGWNWFSLNVELRDMSPGNLFTASSTGNYLKNQFNSTSYYSDYGWFGKLSELNTDNLFVMHSDSDFEIDLWGVPVSPESKSLDIVPGWNWISYLPQEAMTPAEALIFLNPSHLDYVKNQLSSVIFYEGTGWFGNMDFMEPGVGYMFKFANSDQLVYPSASSSKKTRNRESSRGDSLVFNPYDFEYNGTFTGRVEVNGVPAGTPDDILYAMVGDQYRGQVKGKWFEPEEEIVFPLMIYSNISENEHVEFYFYEAATGTLTRCEETILFKNNMVVGDAIDAFTLNVAEVLNVTDRNTRWVNDYSVYPNPFSEKVTIDFFVSEVSDIRLEIYDFYGKLVDILAAGEFERGDYSFEWLVPENPSAVYLVKMNDGENQQVKRLVHLSGVW